MSEPTLAEGSKLKILQPTPPERLGSISSVKTFQRMLPQRPGPSYVSEEWWSSGCRRRGQVRSVSMADDGLMDAAPEARADLSEGGAMDLQMASQRPWPIFFNEGRWSSGCRPRGQGLSTSMRNGGPASEALDPSGRGQNAHRFAKLAFGILKILSPRSYPAHMSLISKRICSKPWALGSQGRWNQHRTVAAKTIFTCSR